jgi:hypothetical protein
MQLEKIGELAFLACVAIAVIAGLVSAEANGMIIGVLVVLGLIVGLLNISEKETTPFLIAAAALIIAGTASFSIIPVAGAYLDRILANIGVFVAPAAVLVALKAVYALASKK